MMAGGASSSAPLTAACVTGQMRGYHLSRTSWKRSREVQHLLGPRVEWFLVTSNTTSYQWYANNVAPEDGGFVHSFVSSGCQTYTPRGANRSWAWRESANGSLEFNLDHFPYLHSNLHGTLLVQHWQLWKCREMIMRREKFHGFQYARVVRFRTDTMVGGFGRRLPDTAPLSPWAARWPSVESNDSKDWALIDDFLLAGSRAAMLQVFLAGLDILQQVLHMSGLQQAWSELHKRANATLGAPPKIYHCRGTEGCKFELSRSVGPPSKLFFLTYGAEADHIRFCESQRIAHAECWRLFADLWRIPDLEREGHDFSYDWPAPDCSDATSASRQHPAHRLRSRF